MEKRGFSKEDSRFLKGCAIMMLLFHHLFLSADRFKGYTVSFAPFPRDFVVSTADAFKICVSIFTFISGYGLFLSFDKIKPHKALRRFRDYSTVKLPSGKDTIPGH